MIETGFCPLSEVEDVLGADAQVLWARTDDVAPGVLHAPARWEATFRGLGGQEFRVVARTPGARDSGIVQISYGDSAREAPLARAGELAGIIARQIGGVLPLYSERFLALGRQLLEGGPSARFVLWRPQERDALSLKGSERQAFFRPPDRVCGVLQRLLRWAHLMEAAAAPMSIGYLYKLVVDRLESMETALQEGRGLDMKGLGDIVGLIEAMKPYIK